MTFTIDVDNNITVVASSQQIEGAKRNRSFQQLAPTGGTSRQVAGITAGRDLERPAGCGTNRAVHQPAGGRHSDLEDHSEPAAHRWRTDAAGGTEQAHCQAQGRPPRATGRRENTKTAKVIALLQQPDGATLRAIVKATGWQTHSVRGFVSGQLKKKLGLKVRSSKRDGERVYSIKSTRC